MNSENTELHLILKDIYEKTGFEVRLAPGHREETPFTLEYCGEKFTAYLDGTGEQAEKTAKLICYLVANSDSQLLPERDDYLKNILLGEGDRRYVYRFMTKFNVQDAPCYALEIIVDKRIAEAISHVES